MRNPLPKRLQAPVGGVSIEDEPDEVKAMRLLEGLRHLAHGNYGTLGLVLDGVKIMVIKYEPTRHGNRDGKADFTGIEL
jgi:hypothetical protein